MIRRLGGATRSCDERRIALVIVRRIMSSRSQGAPLPIVPIFGLMALLGGAFFVVRSMAGDRAADGDGPPAVQRDFSSPFADRPRYEDPTEPRYASGNGGSRRGGDSGRAPRARSIPAQLARHPDWARAQELISLADQLRDRAIEVQREGNVADYRKLAGEAAEKYEEALNMTLEWQTSLEEELGAEDPEVLYLGDTRSDWRRRLQSVRK